MSISCGAYFWAKRLNVLLLIALCSFVTLIGADEVGGLYKVKVSVSDESQAARKIAIKTAVRQMLIKVTGGVDVPTGGAFGSLMSRPSRFVQQFRYERSIDLATSEKRLLLSVSFDSKAVNAELRKARVPIWGSTRPKVLVWMAIEDRVDRQILGQGDDPLLTQMVAELADRRGVPMLLPLMDALDHSKIDFTDVWGGFKNKILSASQRYNADAILIGRVYRDEPDGWQARWTILHRDQSLYWTARGYELTEIFSVGIDGTVDTLASHFAPASIADSLDRPIVLSITGVHNIIQYAELVRYLAKLEPVESVQPIGINADSVEISLALRGNFESLRQVLLLGKKLEVDKPSFPPAAINSPDLSNNAEQPRLYYKIKQ